VIVQDAHDEYCNVLLALGSCNSPAGTAPHQPVANEFPQRLREMGSAIFMVHVNAGSPQTVRHHPMKMPQFQLWNESRGETRAM
jgi:hypothetical protein